MVWLNKVCPEGYQRANFDGASKDETSRSETLPSVVVCGQLWDGWAVQIFRNRSVWIRWRWGVYFITDIIPHIWIGGGGDTNSPMSHTNGRVLHLFASHHTHRTNWWQVRSSNIIRYTHQSHPMQNSVLSTVPLSFLFITKNKEQSRMKATDITCKVTEHDILFGRGGGWVNVMGSSIVYDPETQKRNKETS